VAPIDFPLSRMKSVGFVTRVIREQGTGRELPRSTCRPRPSRRPDLEIVPVAKTTLTDRIVDRR